MMNSEIKNALKYLKDGKTILCPTDTLWGISCDATNFDAVERIFKIKNRDKSKSLIILVNSLEMLSDYIEEVPKNINEILDYTQKPLTVIYPKAKNLPKNAIAKNGSIAIRIVKSGFCNQLISKFKKPIISTSANFSNEATPNSYIEIDADLKNKVDFVVDEFHEVEYSKSSTLISILNNELDVLRD